MGRLIYGLNLSLDGYVDHEHFAPDPALFDHWIDHAKQVRHAIYGRKLYDLMRYWDDDQPDWTEVEKAFARGFRGQRKWVASTTLTAVGPGATLIRGDLVDEVRGIKTATEGDIELGGTEIAQTLGEAGLIDEYRLYLHPLVLGTGTPFFKGAVPRLRLVDSTQFGPDVIRLRYAPA